MVDVAQVTEPVHRWFTRRRAHSETAVPVQAPDGVRIRPRKDSQLASTTRLLGLVSAEGTCPPRRAPGREWLTAADVLEAWVAEEQGRVQGHVAIARIDGDPAAAMRWREVTGRSPAELVAVSRYFVRSGARGRGIGAALLETAVARSRARGLIPVVEMVSTSRRGIPLLDRAGWRLAAMSPYGKRGDGRETYLYVAPTDASPLQPRNGDSTH